MIPCRRVYTSKDIIFTYERERKMKKLLVLISLILCVSMLFAACGKKNDENVQPEENVEANIDKIISELNKADSLQDVFGTVKANVDYEQLVAELKKVSAKGAIDLTATEDGEDVGTVTGSFAIKDNVLHAEANNGEETVGIDASISDAYKLVFAAWIDEEVELDIGEVMAFDIAAIYEELMAQVETGMEEEMPIDLSEIKLPEFTEEHIKYEDGKYILDKQFLYDSIVTTAEAIIDAAKDEGLITEDMDIDSQIADIKEKAQKVVDVVELDIYYVVKSEVIEGMGVSVNVKSADLAKALEADAEDMGFDYIKASIEATMTGSKASLEYKELEDSHINKMSYDVKFLFDGEAICGVDMKYDIDMKTTSNYESGSPADDEYGYWSKNEHTSITKQSVALKFDLSKFDDANATVLDASIKVSSENSSINEHGSNHEATVKNESSSTNDLEITMSVKTTEANKADVVMNGNSHYTYTSTDDYNEDEDSSSTVGLHGTIEFTTKDVTVPAPDADVKDAMDNAEVITSVMGGGVVAPEDSMGPDYNEGMDMVVPMPEENIEW